MRAVAVAIILLGFALIAGLSLTTGLDVPGSLIAALVVAVGCLGIAVTRRSGTGVVRPAECPDCGGLVSPNAPYCKHCGTALADSA